MLPSSLALPNAMSLRLVILGGLVLLSLSDALPAHAQQPDAQARARALCDFHGPDHTGKDGPLAKAGFDLLVLYHRTRVLPDTAALAPLSSTLQTRNGHVALDAVAAHDVDSLRAALDSLGLQDGAQAGRVVSGWFPINNIPALARLSSLRGAQPARAQTRSAPPAVPPAPPPQRSADTSGTTYEKWRSR